MAPRSKAPVRPIAGPDADEGEALAIAARTLQHLSPATHNPEAVATAVITTWIIERVKRTTAGRLHEAVVFDLSNAQLRGELEAALPQIGAALADLPADVPLFALSKAQVVDVFAAGVLGWSAAAVARGEAPGMPYDDKAKPGVPFNDAIPFGDGVAA